MTTTIGNGSIPTAVNVELQVAVIAAQRAAVDAKTSERNVSGVVESAAAASANATTKAAEAAVSATVASDAAGGATTAGNTATAAATTATTKAGEAAASASTATTKAADATAAATTATTKASEASNSATAAAASATAAALFDPSSFYTKVQADLRYYTQSAIDGFLALLAPKANPTFTGTVTITTAANTDISAKAASTAFVKDAGGWDFIAEDQKTSGTGGGTSAVGVQTRTLNTVVVNKLGATLSSNVVTLAPGTYYIEADAAAYAVNASVLKLVNNSGGVLLQIGKGEYSGGSVQTRATLIASALTLAVSTGIRLDHYIAFAQTNGLGSPHSQGTEIYSQIKIKRLA